MRLATLTALPSCFPFLIFTLPIRTHLWDSQHWCWIYKTAHSWILESTHCFCLFIAFDNGKNIAYHQTRLWSFSCWQLWEQSNCKKPNCQPVCDSRLSLTSQMGCNCLINPMFVGFYAFYYGLFSLRAISSASHGEGLCQTHFCCLTSVTSLRMCSQILCRLSRAAPPMKVTGAALSSTPVGHAAAVLLFTFSEQLSGIPYDYGCPAFLSVQRSVKAFFSTVPSQEMTDIWKCHFACAKQF